VVGPVFQASGSRRGERRFSDSRFLSPRGRLRSATGGGKGTGSVAACFSPRRCLSPRFGTTPGTGTAEQHGGASPLRRCHPKAQESIGMRIRKGRRCDIPLPARRSISAKAGRPRQPCAACPELCRRACPEPCRRAVSSTARMYLLIDPMNMLPLSGCVRYFPAPAAWQLKHEQAGGCPLCWLIFPPNR